MKVSDKPRGVLHLGHFFLKPFPYQVLVQLSHWSKAEQAWHAINGNFAGVTWQIEHWNASSNDWINDQENLCWKQVYEFFQSLPWLRVLLPLKICQTVVKNCNFFFPFSLKTVLLLFWIRFWEWQKTCVNQFSKTQFSKISRW